MLNIKNLNLPRNLIMCIDMKSFYSSVECVLRGLPPLTTYMAVVGDLSRPGSVVLASSPPMKKEFRIKTGSRHYEIPKDPRIHVVEARMGRYLEFSMQVPRILNQFTPLEAITVYSVDELFGCFDGCTQLFGDKWALARQIQQRIHIQLGLPCAIGIGENYFQAKICLDVLAKKQADTDYVAEVTYEDFGKELWMTPIKEVWGIGSRMERNLQRLGMNMLGDIARYPVEKLKKRFGIMGEQLYYHAHGIDLTDPYHKNNSKEYPGSIQKGFSSGITLMRDYSGNEAMTPLLDQVEEVARRVRGAKMAGRTIGLSIGYSQDVGSGGFSRSRTLSKPTNITMVMYKTCQEIFRENYHGHMIRIIHVSLTNLEQDEVVQLDLFEDITKQRQLGYVMDRIKAKYGADSIMRARSLTEGGTVKDRAHKIGGHKA